MPNMSYCRFQNTCRDLKDCLDAFNEGEISFDEIRASKKMFNMFLVFCQDNSIIDHFDTNAVDKLFEDAAEDCDDE